MKHAWWRIAGPKGAGSPEPPFVYVPYEINHIISTGQSLSIGYNSVAISLTQPYSNLMFADGVQAVDNFDDPLIPLVEADVETMSSALANEVSSLEIEEGRTHDALVSVHGIGGSTYDQIKKGTLCYTNGMAQVAGGLAQAVALGKTYIVRCVTCVHGESDRVENTPNYFDDLLEWQSDYEADIQEMTGQTDAVPMFISACSAQDGTPGTIDVVLNMLDAHVARPGKIILVTPKFHLTYSDGLHLDAEGYSHMGELYAKAYRRVIIEGGVWEPVHPSGITRDGAVITVTYYVEAPPLVVDTTIVEAQTNYGFTYVKDDEESTVVAITSVEIINDTQIEVTLASDPAGPGFLRYIHATNNAIGNIRDSDATPSRFDYLLYNWGVAFRRPVA